MDNRDIVGVLGGMGPAATVDFMSKVIELTGADSDQQHIPLVVSSMPNIPDRSAHLLHGSSSPLPALLHRLHQLEKAGATVIVMPCNTAHYWFPQLRMAATVEMLNLIEEVVAVAQKAHFSKVGLLATSATLATLLYQKALSQTGMECIAPESTLQQEVMNSIYLCKSGNTTEARQRLEAPYRFLLQQNIEAIILGCTEIPIILAEEVLNKPDYFLDSNKILAQSLVNLYKQKNITI